MFWVKVNEVIPLVHNPDVIFCAYCMLEGTTTVHGGQHCAEGFTPLVAICIREDCLDLTIRKAFIDSQVMLQKKSALVEEASGMHSIPGFSPELPQFLIRWNGGGSLPILLEEDANHLFGELLVCYLEEVETARAGEFASCKPPQCLKPRFKVGKATCGQQTEKCCLGV